LECIKFIRKHRKFWNKSKFFKNAFKHPQKHPSLLLELPSYIQTFFCISIQLIHYALDVCTMHVLLPALSLCHISQMFLFFWYHFNMTYVWNIYLSTYTSHYRRREMKMDEKIFFFSKGLGWNIIITFRIVHDCSITANALFLSRATGRFIKCSF
jgi:hypothetical protein